jgi:hypothetical protein
MKTLFLIAILLLTQSCFFIIPPLVVPPEALDPNRPYGFFGLMTIPDANKATINTFSRVPQDYAMRYVAEISNTAQQNGLRCKPGLPVTNRDIYYEIMTRLNAGKYSRTDSLIGAQYNVMNDLGCN